MLLAPFLADTTAHARGNAWHDRVREVCPSGMAYDVNAGCIAAAKKPKASGSRPNQVTSADRWSACATNNGQAQCTFGAAEAAQYLLIWAGGYNGLVDGILGPQSRAATLRWATRRYGTPPASFLPQHDDDLVGDARSASHAVGFVILRDQQLGVTFGVPTLLLTGAKRRSAATDVPCTGWFRGA